MFQKYDPRVDYLNPALNMLKDCGVTNFLYNKRMPAKKGKESGNSIQNRPLVIEHFYLPCAIAAFGLAMASLQLVHESTNRS